MSDFPEVNVPEDLGREGNPLHPYDPYCKRYAADMVYLNTFLFESAEDEAARGPATPQMREAYVIEEEGTYNHLNGHFTCDDCYITLRMPSRPGGWKCP
jgi:hypothetical protein